MRGAITGDIYFKHEDEKNKLRIGGGSWTINWKEVAGKEIDQIIYQTLEARYGIEMNKAHEKGFFRTFKGEVKLVVPIKNWKRTDLNQKKK